MMACCGNASRRTSLLFRIVKQPNPEENSDMHSSGTVKVVGKWFRISTEEDEVEDGLCCRS